MKILRVLMAMCIFLSILVPVSATAQLSVEVYDVEKNIISVSGSAPNDTFVTVVVLNPGYTLQDIDQNAETGDSNVIQYFGFAKSQSGKFEKKIEINTESGGVFTAYASSGDTISDKEFRFYCYEVKRGYVEDIKGFSTVEEAAEALPEILSTYSLDTHPLYNASQIGSVAKLVCSMNKTAEIETPKSAEAFLIKALLVNAYNHDSDAAFLNDKIAYADVLELSEDKWYQQYSADLSDDGFKAVKNGLFAKNYTDTDGIKSQFKSLVMYNVLMNNKTYGADHIGWYVENFEADFKAKGFDTDAYKKSDKKKAVFLKLLQCDATDIKTLADEFNELFSEKNSGKLPSATVSSGGGGGGGGGAKPTPTPTVVPAPSATTEPDKTPVPTTLPAYPFKDMENTQWAKDAVKALYEKNIINGRSDSEFVPDATVTRAEFVKLVVEALGITENSGENFADVTEDDWFMPYVARAYTAQIITGANGNFMPGGNITREDAAVIIARALKMDMSGNSSFADENQISDYAKGAVATLSENKIINGVGDNMYAPKGLLTRAQAAVLIYNILGGAAE